MRLRGATRGVGAVPWLILRRLTVAVPSLAAVTLLVFWLASLSPRDPLRTYLGSRYERLGVEDRSRLAEGLGIDEPWPVHWAHWAGDVLQGWWGVSLLHGQPVTEVVAQRLPVSAALGGTALVLAALVALVLALAGLGRPGGPADRAGEALALVLQALPPFVVALGLTGLAAATGATVLGIAEASGHAASGAGRSMLPAVALAVGQVPWLFVTLREGLGAAAGSEYVAAAVGRGIPRHRLVLAHILPVALVPFAAALGQRIPELVTGALVIETVFAVPGLAEATVQAALSADFALLAAVTLLACAAALAGSLAADALALTTDPRITDV